jgi:hypothetical protein
VKHLSIFTWFRPDHAAFFEHVNRETGILFHWRACVSLFFVASTEKLFFASSSVRIASLEKKRDQNERICNGKRSIFWNGWAK